MATEFRVVKHIAAEMQVIGYVAVWTLIQAARRPLRIAFAWNAVQVLRASVATCRRALFKLAQKAMRKNRRRKWLDME